MTPVTAEETATATNETTLSTTEEIIETDALAAAPAIDLTADCAILNYVDEEVFAAGNHVLRLPEEETLSSYVFLNADGTKTVYYLDEAVKFVDGDGNIQEKDVTLALSGTAYTTTRNDISLSIPNDPASGITLLWKGHAVRIIPQGGTLSDTVLDGNSIRYTDYYGAGADLVYTPTLTGVKEDIVLESYTGQNVFTFMLNTGGLNLYSLNGRYYLAESKTATDRIELGDLVTFDANGRFSVGTMTSQTISAGNIYRLTLTVDEAFLTDPNTVYPVTIDPELNISDTTHGAGAIEDVNIYEGTPNANADWKYMHVGYYDDTYEVGRILVRLTDLINDTEYQNMSSSQITSATFYMTEATGKAAAEIKLYAFKGNSNWTESGATWNNVGADNFGDLIDTVNHGRNSKAGYDITDFLKGWKEGKSAATAGLILCHSSEDTATKGFYSSEYTSNTDYRPYVKVVYDSTSGMIDPHEDYVAEDDTITLHVSGVSAQITWSSSNTSIATVDQNGNVTGVKAGQVNITASATGYTDKVCTIWVTVPDDVYYIKNNLSGHYLSVLNSAVASGTEVYQETQRTTNPTYLSQLWKICYIADGYYTIRPMHRLSSALTANGTAVEIISTTIDETYETFPSSRLWTITYQSGGYAFMLGGNYYKAMFPSGLSASANQQIIAGSYSASTTAFRWTLSKPSPSVSNQVVFYDSASKTLKTTATRYIAPGETLSLSALGLSASFVSEGTNAQGISWYSSNSAVTVNASNGQITGVTPGGTAYIYAKQTYNGVTYRRYYFVRVTDIAEGTYFIRNKQTDTYMQIDDDVSSYSTDGAAMELWDFDGGSYQKWTFTRLDDGYYSVKSSTSGLALSVQESYVNSSGQSLVQEEYEALDRQKWKVSVTSSGSYILRPKSATNVNYDTDWCMSAGAESSGDTPVQQATYVSDSDYTDEWSFYSTTIPLTGYELDYEPEVWNYYPVVNYTNCYAYALNNQIDPIHTAFGVNGLSTQQPGQFYNANLSAGEVAIDTSDYETNPSVIVDAVMADFNKYNELFGTDYVFVSLPTADAACPEGTYKVALCIRPATLLRDADYHWYRQDSNFKWSHKPGRTNVIQTDGSEVTIYRPDIADRNGYEIFVGYFAITPWNNMYSGTSNQIADSYVLDEHTNLDVPLEASACHAISVNMPMEEVVDILGYVGENIGYGTIIHKYHTSDGAVAIVSYQIDPTGVFRVSQVYIGEDMHEEN